jgi:hypothetical protein
MLGATATKHGRWHHEPSARKTAINGSQKNRVPGIQTREPKLGNQKSVVTTGNQDGENHQVGVGEHPALGMLSGFDSSAHDRTQVFAASQVAQVFAADAGQARDLFLREDFLTRLDGNHGCPPIDSLRPFRPSLTWQLTRSREKTAFIVQTCRMILQEYFRFILILV